MLSQLVLIALATLASEDLTLAATGVLIAQGSLDFSKGAAACIAGIFGGDMLIYFAGRTLGRGARRWRLLDRLIPAGAIARGAEWLNHRGLAVVFLSRFTPGLRLPTYFAAGLLPTKAPAFATYFFLASLVWTPLFLGVTGWLGHRVPVSGFGGTSLAAFGIPFAAMAGGNWLVRRALGSAWLRRLRWEFWPAWAAYLPLIPYFIYLAIRRRSLTVFTAANPGIATGGFVGESKAAILGGFAPGSAPVAEFETIPAALDPAVKVQRAQAFGERYGWPMVLKPDVGERGSGVAIVRSPGELAHYMAAARGGTIAQRFVPGLEFGIFYYRFPGEPRGHIFSITEKRFPVLTGDGASTLRELILDDRRAACLAPTYFKLTRYPLHWVPGAGESVQPVEIGSHCRGAIFLDGGRLATPELEEAVDRISRAREGFYFGRYDVRSDSEADLRAGRFTILELNGVSAEATHIYDPAVSLYQAYRVMFTQWRLAFEIGEANRKLGAEPTSWWELCAAIARRPERD